ncbi:MAG: lipolytic enzyme [Sphingobium sp.]|nr:MAG: lipolytic enzyme [Sphingobium sp.]
MRMILSARMLKATAYVLAVAVMPVPLHADTFSRFVPEIEAFSRQAAPAPGQASRAPAQRTLFLGSSSVRLWDVTHGFPGISATNRGFGGATTPDVLHFYRQVTAGTPPANVVVYVGENDVAAGTLPEEVADDVLTLLDRIHDDFPKAHIAYLSMKPSPARWALWPKMAQVNRIVRSKAGRDFTYVDVASSLLDRDGRPEDAYFRPDGLHMNAAGYARWNAIVDDYVEPDGPAETPPPPTSPAPVAPTGETKTATS